MVLDAYPPFSRFGLDDTNRLEDEGIHLEGRGGEIEVNPHFASASAGVENPYPQVDRVAAFFGGRTHRRNRPAVRSVCRQVQVKESVDLYR